METCLAVMASYWNAVDHHTKLVMSSVCGLGDPQQKFLNKMSP